MNKATFFGNLTRDVELRTLPNGTPVADFCMALNERWVSDGEKKEKTTFIDLCMFGKRAETLAQYVSKGDPLIITDSSVEVQNWTDKDGNKRKTTRFRVNDFEFVGRGQSKSSRPSNDVVKTQNDTAEMDEDDDDDIPF